MLIPSCLRMYRSSFSSLSRRVNANSQQAAIKQANTDKLIKKGEC